MSHLLTLSIVAWLFTVILADSSKHSKGRPWGTFSDSKKTYAVPGQYIVMLRDGADPVDKMENLVNAYSVPSLRTHGRMVFGKKQFFTVSASDDELAKLMALPEVSIVEPNTIAFAFDHPRNVTASARVSAACTTQNAWQVWGLDRIDQREKTPSGVDKQYIHGTYDGTGNGVMVYVADSGVDINNTEFGGRATWGYTAPDMDGDLDLNGHGTHVAGTIGANTYGVAKETNIIAVKVLNAEGSGPISGIITGLQWIIDDFHSRGKPSSVINLSLGFFGISSSFDDVLQSVIDAGISVVAAAGNEYDDACNYSPAHTTDAITVGAIDINDIPTSFTNWGTCLDIWAPGKDILSTTPDGPQSFDGTSMAAPHVTGVIARYLSTMMVSPRPTPAEVAHWLDVMTTKDRVIFENNDERTSPNKLSYIDCADSWTTPYPATVRTTTAGSDAKRPSIMLLIVATVAVLY